MTFGTPQDVVLGLGVGATAALSGAGAGVAVRELRRGALESGTALAISFSAPASNGGFAVLRYDLDYDVSPTFASSSPSDRGSLALTDAGLLFGTQVVQLTVGSGRGGVGVGAGAGAGGCSLAGSFVLQYNSTTTLGLSAAQLAARRTAPLDVSASGEDVRMALEALDGIAAASVELRLSRVQLEDVSATGASALTGVPAGPALDGLLLSSPVLTDAQLNVSDLVWVAAPNAAFDEAAPFRVRAKALDSATGLAVLMLGTVDGAPSGTPSDSAARPAYLPAALLGTSPLNLFRWGGGPAFVVTLTSLGGAAPLPLYAPQPQLACAATSGAAPGAAADALVDAAVAHEPCRGCLALPALLKGQPYFARLWATNAVGRSLVAAFPAPPSAAPQAVPSAPTAVALTALSDSQLQVTWALPSDDGRGGALGLAVQAYVVQWDPAPTFDSGGADPATPGASLPLGSATLAAAALAGAAPPFAHTIGGLTNGTVLFARVLAASAIGFDDNSAWTADEPFESNRAWAYSVPASAATAFQPPSAPAAIALELLSGSALRLTLQPSLFDGGLPVSRYELGLAASQSALASPGATLVPIAVDAWRPLLASASAAAAAAGPQLFDLEGLVSGASYFVRVRAVNAAGASAWTASSPAFETPRAKPGPPLAVLAASSAVAPLTSLSISWAPPAGAGGGAPGSGSGAGAPGGSPLTGVLVEAWSDRVVYEVQRLTVSDAFGRSDILCASAPGPSPTDACFLQLIFGGRISVNFPLDESAEDVRHHLMTSLALSGALVPHVDVRRELEETGFAWFITFSGPPGALADAPGLGDVPALQLGDSTAFHSLAQNSAGECGLGASVPTGTHDNSCISIALETLTDGTRRYGAGEMQVLTIAADRDAAEAAAPGVLGWYRLTFGTGGARSTTPYLPVTASAAEVQAVVGELPAARGVAVSIAPLAGAALTVLSAAGAPLVRASGAGAGAAFAAAAAHVQAVNAAPGAGLFSGFVISLSYARQDGNVGPVAIDAARLTSAAPGGALLALAADADNAQDGLGRPLCAGCAVGERPADYVALRLPPSTQGVTLGNLTAGRRYYVQVSAQNDRGVGAPALAACSPSGSALCSADLAGPFAVQGAAGSPQAGAAADPFGLRVVVQAPAPPATATLSVDPRGDSSRLQVLFSPPVSDGGSLVRAYRVEWSTAPDFGAGALGRLDLECPTAAARTVIALRAGTADGRGIAAGGLFFLTVTHGSQSRRTQDLRIEALARAADELAQPPQFSANSAVFCESAAVDSVVPITSPIVPCSSPVAHPGSLESALRALPFVGAAGVQVSVTPLPSGAANEVLWLITFLADGGDWAVAPTAVSLQRADDLAALATADALSVSTVTLGVAAASLAGCVSVPVALEGLTQGASNSQRACTRKPPPKRSREPTTIANLSNPNPSADPILRARLRC